MKKIPPCVKQSEVGFQNLLTLPLIVTLKNYFVVKISIKKWTQLSPTTKKKWWVKSGIAQQQNKQLQEYT